MAFEPQKFFVGLVDFFSVLMPGGLLAYLGKDWAAQALFGKYNFKIEGGEAWMVFLFASYLLGHFIFLIGSLLDDRVYEPLRKCTDRGQVRKLAVGGRMSPRWVRKVAKSRWFFKETADEAVTKVERLKARSLISLSAQDAMNGYQWSKIWLSEKHPEGLSAVQRFEADSKFFRSFVILLPVLAAILSYKGQHDPALVCFILLLPALWRYVDQRFKATQHAYWYVLTLESMNPSPAVALIAPREDSTTHAGGVVFRENGQTVEYLLLEANKNRTEWVLPKGHIEPGEDTRETAVREVLEETGYWARVVRWIDDVPFENQGNTFVTRFFLMECMQSVRSTVSKTTNVLGGEWPLENRQHIWLTLDKAKEKATFPETKQLLDKAEDVLRHLTPKKKVRTEAPQANL